MKIPKFLDLLQDVLTKEQNENSARRSTYGVRHNPSSASVRDGSRVIGACLRQLYYKSTGEPVSEPSDGGSLLKMDFGNVIHDYLADKLKKIPGLNYTEEFPGKLLVDDLTKELSYRLDGLVLTGEEYAGSTGGVEIKTVFGRKMDSIKVEGPSEDHLLQIVCYFKALPSVKWFSLLYFARDTGYRIEFHIWREGEDLYIQGPSIPYPKKLHYKWEQIKERFKEYEGYLERKELPPRDYKVWLNSSGEVMNVKTIKGEKYKSDWRCTYCAYKTKCWSQPDAFKESYNSKEV